MSKKNGKKIVDPNVVNAPLEVSSEEVLTNEEVTAEAPVVEADTVNANGTSISKEVLDKAVEEAVEEPEAEEVKEEVPVEEVVETLVDEPVPIVEEVKEEVKEEPVVKKKEEVKPVENSKFAGEYVICIYTNSRKSIDDIVNDLNSNRRFVADNIIVDRDKDRVVLETSDDTEVLRKTQKKYISAGIKTVIDKA